MTLGLQLARPLAPLAAYFTSGSGYVVAQIAHDGTAPERAASDDYDRAVLAAEDRVLTDLIRCVLGNPFRPTTPEPAWLTSDVVALAEGVYRDQAFDRMPVLADALMDAGADDEAMLAHCRSDGPHARGCWVLDRLLSRA